MKLFRYAFICSLLILILSAFAPLAQIELPPEVTPILNFLLIAVVTQVLKWAGSKAGVKLENWAAAITAALVSLIVVVVNAGLTAVPVTWEPYVNLLFQGLLYWFGSLGIYAVKREVTKSAAPVG